MWQIGTEWGSKGSASSTTSLFPLFPEGLTFSVGKPTSLPLYLAPSLSLALPPWEFFVMALDHTDCSFMASSSLYSILFL